MYVFGFSFQNAISLAQTNAENYPINPDFQLQPHLTGLLLPQQSKKVPELYSVDSYNAASGGSITANMNTNYFSSNKSYPEPKIIEYDMEETSTESSPQHTSSLYSESTDQDSESIPSNIQFSKRMSNKTTECHVTKESKTITSSNQEFPVPSQFADLSLNRDNSIDDHQHSILHSAYNQDDDTNEDITKTLTDNTNQNEIKPISENQENPKSQFNVQNFNTLRTRPFDYYANTNDFRQTEFKHESTPRDSSSTVSNNNTNYLPYGVTGSSNVQNHSEFNMGKYFSQSNTLSQPNSLSSSVSQSLQYKSFPYSDTELFSHQQESLNIQHHNDDVTQSGDYSHQNKHIESVIQNSNVPPNDSKLQSNIVNSTNKQISNQSISQQDQTLNVHNNCQSINTSVANSCNQQYSMYNPSKPPVSELLSGSQPIISQQCTPLSSSQSVGPVTSTINTTPKSSTSVPEDVCKVNQSAPPQQTSDDQTSHSNLSNTTRNSPLSLRSHDSSNVLTSEFNNKLLQSPSNDLAEGQQETIVDQSKSTDKQSNENLHNCVASSLPPAGHFTRPDSYFTSKDTTCQQQSSYQKPDQFASLQSTFDNINTSNNQFSNNSIHFLPNLENTTSEQQSVSTTSHSVSHYFNSTNVNNKSAFNCQLPNLQSYSQQQNVHPHDLKPVATSSPPSDKSNNFMTVFSNSQNTLINSISSNQQQLPIKREVESSQLNSDTMSSNETESVSIHSNNVNIKSLENTKILSSNSLTSDHTIPNDQFSNMTIDNKQNIPVGHTFNQVKTTAASYFSKNTSFNDENNFAAFQSCSSTVHNTNDVVSELPKISPSTQTNSQSPNLDSMSIIHSPTDNKTVSDKPETVQLETNKFSSEQFGSKTTPNAVPPVSFATFQPLSQMFGELNVLPPFLPPTQSSSNQSLTNTVSDVSLASNQFPPKMFNNQPKTSILPPLQSTPSLYPTQPISVAPESNQSPSNTSSNKSKSDIVPPFQSTPSPYQPQPFNNQPAPTSVTFVSSNVKQFSPQMFSNQPKSDSGSYQSTPSPFPTQPFNNELKSNVVTPVVSSPSKQFPSQSFNSQGKPETIPPLQPEAIGYPAVQSTQNTNTSMSNQLTSQLIGNPPKSGVTPSLQPAGSQCHQVQPFSNQPTPNTVLPTSTASQLPTQMFDNQFKLDASHTSGQYPLQPFNNQQRSNMAPPIPPGVNQLPPQVLTNQSKSVAFPVQPTINQCPPLQSPGNQARLNTVSPDSSRDNQFSSQMLNIQPKVDTGPLNKPITSRYPSQMQSSQLMSSIPLVSQQVPNQYPPQPFSSQSKPNTFAPSQSVTNQYPLQTFNNQLGQQVLPKPNYSVPPSNQFYNQTNSTQPSHHNKWPPHPNVNQASQQLSNTPLNIPNQTNTMYPQQKSTNTTFPNSISLHSGVNQQTQRLGSQTLPPSNNYYNQTQGNDNVQHPQPSAMLPNPNIQLASKGYPQQNNISAPNLMNYQQSSATVHGQQGFYNQQDASYRQEQIPSVVQQGFTKTWVSLLFET